LRCKQRGAIEISHRLEWDGDRRTTCPGFSVFPARSERSARNIDNLAGRPRQPLAGQRATTNRSSRQQSELNLLLNCVLDWDSMLLRIYRLRRLNNYDFFLRTKVIYIILELLICFKCIFFYLDVKRDNFKGSLL